MKKVPLPLLIGCIAMLSPIRAYAAPDLQVAAISEKIDDRCGIACTNVEIKSGTPLTILDPASPRVCEGKAGTPFSINEESEEGSFSWHLSPINVLKPCSFVVRALDLVVVNEKVNRYAPIILEELKEPREIQNADAIVRSSKLIDNFLESKYGSSPAQYGRYTVQDLTQHRPQVFRWPNIKSDVLLLDYEIASLKHSGPTFAVVHGKPQRITDICGGPKVAFEINGFPYLQIGSRDCCECDMPNGGDRLFGVSANGLDLISDQGPGE